MNGSIRSALAIAALGGAGLLSVGFTTAPASAAALEGAHTPAASSAGTTRGLACVQPDSGWVIFYAASNCGGAYQGWTRCGRHNFTGAMYREASSYNDRQYGGAYTNVFDSDGSFVFRTWPNTGVRNVALWENDSNAFADLVC
jgi:hypothetical protein